MVNLFWGNGSAFFPPEAVVVVKNTDGMGNYCAFLR